MCHSTTLTAQRCTKYGGHPCRRSSMVYFACAACSQLQETACEIQPEDIQVIKPLGQGSSGIVQKVLHLPTNRVFALKVTVAAHARTLACSGHTRTLACSGHARSLTAKQLSKLSASETCARLCVGCVQVIPLEAEVGMRKQILQELRTLHSESSCTQKHHTLNYPTTVTCIECFFFVLCVFLAFYF